MQKLSSTLLWFWIITVLVLSGTTTALALDCATYLFGIEKTCELSSDDDWEYSDCVYASMADGGFEDKEHYTRAGRDADGYPLFTCGRLVCLNAIAKYHKTCVSRDQINQKSCFKSSLEKSGLAEGKDFKFSPKTGRLFCK